MQSGPVSKRHAWKPWPRDLEGLEGRTFCPQIARATEQACTIANAIRAAIAITAAVRLCGGYLIVEQGFKSYRHTGKSRTTPSAVRRPPSVAASPSSLVDGGTAEQARALTLPPKGGRASHGAR